jgi:hypothetical protein
LSFDRAAKLGDAEQGAGSREQGAGSTEYVTEEEAEYIAQLDCEFCVRLSEQLSRRPDKIDQISKFQERPSS